MIHLRAISVLMKGSLRSACHHLWSRPFLSQQQLGMDCGALANLLLGWPWQRSPLLQLFGDLMKLVSMRSKPVVMWLGEVLLMMATDFGTPLVVVPRAILQVVQYAMP